MGQTLATEILKVKHMCPEITSNILNACKGMRVSTICALGTTLELLL